MYSFVLTLAAVMLGVPALDSRLLVASPMNSSAEQLYAADNGTMYELGLPGAQFTTQFTIPPDTFGIKIDRRGNLYLPSSTPGTESVSVYVRGSTNPDFVYANSWIYGPADVAIAPNGDLYVADDCCLGSSSYNPPWILAFHRHVNTPYRVTTLPGQTPNGLAVDASGNLYVTTFVQNQKLFGHVFEIAPNKNPVDLQLEGLADPVGIAFDPAGNLVVFDPYSNDQLSVFPPGARTASRTISGLGDIPGAGYLAFSPSGRSLFISTTVNVGGSHYENVVEELDYGTGKVRRTIENGMAWHPRGLAVGAERLP